MKRLLLIFPLILLAACGPTAAGRVDNNPALYPTAQAQEFAQDAAATQTSREIERNGIETEIAQTAQAQAVRAAQTRQSLQTTAAVATEQYYDRRTATAKAEIQATQTYVAQVTADYAEAIRVTQQYEDDWRASQTATAQAEVALTGTATVIDTQTAVLLRNEADKARWQRFRTGALSFLLILANLSGLAVLSGLGWALYRLLRARPYVTRYGTHENVALTVSGWGGEVATVNPNRMPGGALTVGKHAEMSVPQLAAPADQERTTARDQLRQLTSAQHSPHTAVASTEDTSKTRWGPVQREHTQKTGATTNGKPVRIPDLEIPQRPQQSTLPALPSLDKLVLGTTMQGAPLVASAANMVHVLVGGASGWGKTKFLEWLGAQIRASGQADLAVIDYKGGLTRLFADSAVYTAQTEAQALELFGILLKEMERRKAHPAQRPLIVLADEATTMLDNPEVAGMAKTLLQLSREYLLWMIWGGQDWKAITSAISTTREQFSTRVAFHYNSASASRVVLGSPDAATLQKRGEAIAILPGRQPVRFTVPHISETEIVGATPVNIREVPRERLADPASQLAEKLRPVYERQMNNGGLNKSELAREAGFSQYGGSFAAQIDEALEKLVE